MTFAVYLKAKYFRNFRRQKIKRISNEEKGITLIALVITIVVLLILASVLIAMLTGSNGLITKANESKIQTVLAGVRETIQLEKQSAYMNNSEVTPETLLAEGKVTRTIQQGKDEKYYMHYVLKQGAYQSMQEYGKGNIASLRDVFLIDENLKIKYIDNNGNEYGDNLEEKILEDETQIRFSSKAFSEYVSKISGVSEENMKFKWMKNQTNLTIDDENIENLQDLIFFPNLTYLNIGSKSIKISSLDGMESCSKLESLYININLKGGYLPFAKLTNLITAGFNNAGNQTSFENIIDALKYCKKLKNVTFSNMEISNMKKIGELGNLYNLTMRANSIEKIEGIENMTDLKYLYLGKNKIEKIENLEKLSNLSVLDLAENDIQDITPLKENTNLKELRLKNNKKIDENRNNYKGDKLAALNKISEILDKDGSIELDIDKIGLFNNYKTLNLSSSGLETLDILEGFTSLKSLNINYNKITLSDKKSQDILKSMQNLTTLTANGNKLSDITPINSLKNLTNLQITETNANLKQIEDIISNITVLRVADDSIMTLEQCDANKVTALYLNGTYTKLPDLSKFENLKILHLKQDSAYKNISNIEVISKIESLRTLNTNVYLHAKNIDFSKLTSLTTLTLERTGLWTEDLVNLKALKNNEDLTIDLRNNSIIDAEALLELKPGTKIYLSGNINLTQDSKNKLKERFRNNVIF